MREEINVEDGAFVSDGDEEFGAVRRVSADAIVVYVENAGEFVIPRKAVKAVHYKKVVFDCDKLDPELRAAIGHAHDAETRS
ncbi:MAG: hypothetical protein ACRES7_11950 [Gammaproteobacteria bacterium]